MITSTRSQTFGGNGGSSFDDTHNIDAWGRVTQIIVRHGSEVDSLGVFWANGNFFIHGGTGGTETVIILDPDEFISRVDGRSGDRLDQITFRSNKRTYGPFGGGGGSPFTVDFSGKALHYLFGRSGSEIDQVGFGYGDQPAAAKHISLRAAVSPYANHAVSMGGIAQKLGMKRPVSLISVRDKLDGMPKSLNLPPQTWTTSDGSTLGGTVTLTINSNGTYFIEFDTIIHSPVPGFSCSFQVRAYLSAPGLPHNFLFVHAGDIAGDLLKGYGEDDHQESGSNPFIAMYWNLIINSPTLQVLHDQQASGIIGAVVHVVDTLVKDLVDVAAAAAGAAIGLIIGVTREAIGWLGTSLGPGTTIGVIAGVAVFAIGAIAGLGIGSALILGTVAGVAAGSVSNALIQTRPMSSVEIAIAQKVFGSELTFGNVLFTNLAGQNGRAFTAPGVDGKTYCNLGQAFNTTLSPGNCPYPFNGELMIHELTHAWQIAHNSFLPGFVCSAIVNQAAYSMGDNVYLYGPPGPDFSTFNLEQQAQIVNQWYAGKNDNCGANPQSGYNTMDTAANPYFEYIKGNILTGAAGFSTNWL